MNHRTIAVIPVYGRTPLVRITVRRLLKVNGCAEVVCVGSLPDDKAACIEEGAKWVDFPNYFLGAKWNAGFKYAQHFDPDSCLFVGSSDWLSEDWLKVMQPYLKTRAMVGKLDTYFIDHHKRKGLRAIHWPGYTQSRKGETIGIGRLLSRTILEKLAWKPFDGKLNNSLDYSMVQKVASTGGQATACYSDDIAALSISCDQWENKHRFDNEAKVPGATSVNAQELIERFKFHELKELFL